MTAQRRMIERTQMRFGIWPERLVADAAYGSAPNLAWLVEDMLPETRAKSQAEAELASLTQTRDLLVKQRTRLLHKIYALHVRKGL